MAQQPSRSGNTAARPGSGELGPSRAAVDLSKKSPATRIAGFATNVLATGLILILGAVGGQHMLRWWSAARSASPAGVLADVIGPGAVPRQQPPGDSQAAEFPRQMLAFGDLPLLATRFELRGDTRDVLARLRAECRSMAERVKHVDRTPGPAERHLLARIRDREPVDSSANWRMYQLDRPLPLVVTVFNQSARQAAEMVDNVAAESRVVSWGLAFPAISDEAMSKEAMSKEAMSKEAMSKEAGLDEAASDEAGPSDRWTLFILTAESPRLISVAAGRDLPIPPQAVRTMSLQAESGAVMVGLRGMGSALEWRTFYDGTLAVPTWTPASVWRHDGSSWQRSFISPRLGRLDVQLVEAADGSITGLLMAAPRPTTDTVDNHEATEN